MVALPREELQVRAACKLTFRWTRLDASTVHDNKVTIVLIFLWQNFAILWKLLKKEYNVKIQKKNPKNERNLKICQNLDQHTTWKDDKIYMIIFKMILHERMN